MIEINELRRLAQAANEHSDDRAEILAEFYAVTQSDTIIELLDRLEAAEMAWKEADKACRDLTEKVIPNLRKSLEAAEKDRDGVMQQLVRSEVDKQNISEAHKVVTSRLSSLADENVTLRARIEAMEQQEPIAWGAFYFGGKLNGKLYSQCDTEAQIDMYIADRHQSDDSNTFRKAPIYALPGAQPASSINDGVRKVTLDFRWESEAQHHIPTIEIEFDPVSPDSPNDAKGWQDRDRIASMLSPEAKP